MVAADEQLLCSLVRNGALHGALHIDELATAFVPLLRAVASGATCFSQLVVSEAIPQVTIDPQWTTTHHNLNSQEQELLRLISAGYSNGQIAARMNLREQTVRNYVSRLYEKFDVSGRSQLLLALRKLVSDL